MRYFKNIVFILLLSFAVISCGEKQQQVSRRDPNPLLLISFDGFRYDYLSKTNTPNFDSLIANGVKAKRLIPVFPTKTFPNHYSIVTGLYPEHSGIVGNTMYDPQFDAWYSIGDSAAVANVKWYEGEPIWNTAEKQGLKTGVFFWVGSEAPIQQMRPTYWKPFDGSVPAKTRIDTVVKWLSYDEERAVDFATLYFEFVDAAGHRYGTNSEELVAALQKADRIMGYLKKKLKQNELWKKMNIIVLSDHGMVNQSAKKTIMLSSIINMNDVKRVIWGPATMIWPKEGSKEQMYQQLQKMAVHYSIYKKKELPERYHLDHRRIAPLIIVADLGYTILSKEYKSTFMQRLPSATHGYDNYEKKMQSIFLARGPAFKEGLVVPPFQNIHIYELMTHLLGLTPAPSDGSLDSVKVLLKEK